MKRIVIAALVCAAAACSAQTAHYLDCAEGSDAANALAPRAAWRTVTQANTYEFKPGDSLLLRRGTRCEGMLWPKGSGTAAAPIHLGAYGSGALPIVVGGTASAGLKLEDQQYWEIENLEVMGGSPYGIRIGGTASVLRHFRLTNLVVHDVFGEPTTKDSGLVVIAPNEKADTLIEDVVVDGVTAYKTSQWAGIIVNGAAFDTPDNGPHGNNITVRNSIVHDVAGDGILLARVAHGVLEHNVAWNTGMQETETIGTPDAIWEWMCRDCHIAYNEGFFSDSPGVDGGVFDIDFGNEDNIVENNFGHDSQGYCVSIFGAEGTTGNSTRSTIRNNVCIHNGRSPRLAKRQGAIYLSTWRGGRLNGFDIENNTVLWDPPLDTAAFQSNAEFTGDVPNRFTGNTILAVSGSFVAALPGIQFAHNRYCAPPARSAVFTLADNKHSADTHDVADDVAPTDDLCTCMHDWLATSGVDLRSESPTHAGSWVLVAVLASQGLQAAASRSEAVVLASMMHQYADRGLRAVLVPASSMTATQIENWRADWNLDATIPIDAMHAEKLRATYRVAAPELVLIAPSGAVDARWHAPIDSASVWLRLQSRLGAPDGTQPIFTCKDTVIR